MDFDTPVFSGPEVTALAGYAQPNALDHTRLGRFLGLGPVGSGNYRQLTPRQAIIACVMADVLDPDNAARATRRGHAIAAALHDREWSDYLVVNDDPLSPLWVNDPEAAVRIAQAHTPLTTTIVPTGPYVDRVIRALP